ncbi:hypothetical protein PM082_016096 [Marasmius tenuissimus]|nr:hypothetical protein PM082_016096 [Marasmius tenuissimus]
MSEEVEHVLRLGITPKRSMSSCRIELEFSALSKSAHGRVYVKPRSSCQQLPLPTLCSLKDPLRSFTPPSHWNGYRKRDRDGGRDRSRSYIRCHANWRNDIHGIIWNYYFADIFLLSTLRIGRFGSESVGIFNMVCSKLQYPSAAQLNVFERRRILDTLHVVFTGHSMYYYLITQYGQPSSLRAGIWYGILT